MCGIIGYVGFREARTVLLESLKRLDYRGYDSAGVAIIDKHLKTYKEVGEIANVEKKIPLLKGTTGIGHTRWATHGAVTKENAHPHLSCDKKIAIVHNGIIENYTALKEELKKKGHRFLSQTDSEVIVHLIDDVYKGNLEDALIAAIKKIKGSYAIVAVSQDEPGKIIGARNESPLVIGVGDSENFIASDITAFLKYTNRVMFLNDGELCVITTDSIQVLDRNKNHIKKKEELITWDVTDAEKSGFPHFMLKEIYDQPETVHHVLRGRISEMEEKITFPDPVEKLLKAELNSIHIVACGTSFYAGFVGKYLIEQLTNIPVFVEPASEYRYFGSRNETSLIIAITQSGETADTLAALREARLSGSKTLVITNIIGSTATRIADGYILQQSGPEIGVAATKTFTSQIMVLFLLALKIAIYQKKLGSNELYNYLLHLKYLPRHVRDVLERSDEIIAVASHLKDATSVFFIGRGINYPLSLEGALKLKEISYIHAEGFAAGELKHGPFALLTKDTPVVAIVTQDETYEKILANIGEIKARGSPVIAIAEDKDTEIENHADYVLRFPTSPHLLPCIPITVVLQLLAYHVADLRKCPIDKPRNLAKSVTVE
ncbi:MAG: glutamine--fructose-6-phosphate transaminase (isomerizing) [Candidatus Thermoplasmatota archaeon]